jgi:Xaa-Pro dipeptidase
MQLEKTLAFPKAEYQERLRRIRERMAKQNLSGMLLHTPENICYISGHQTPGYYYTQMLIVPMDREPVIVTRLFEQRNVDAFSWLPRAQSLAYKDTENPIAVIAATVSDFGMNTGRLGIEMSGFFLPIDKYMELASLLPNATLVNASGIVEAERVVKSPAEIAYIRQSCRISEKGMQAAWDNCHAGITENALSGHIHKALVENGGEFPGLPVFIGSGYRTQIPHVQWTDKVIEKGDNVPVELTGVMKRYAGPLFRTFAVGESKKMAEDFEVVKDQLEAAHAAMRPGVTSHDVDAAAKRAAAKHGRLASFTKRTGYSVGLNFCPDWGEGHIMDLKENDPSVLVAGMVFHTPMSLRADGDLAVAVSETVMVTPTGHEVLTNFPRKLIVV